MACGTAASMIAPVPALAIGARALTGLGTGTGFIAATAYVRRSGGSALAQGLFGGITLGAAGVAIAVVPQLTSSLSWRAPYATALALAVVALIWLMTGPADHGGELAATARSPARLLSDTKLYPVAFVYAATYGTGLVLSNWVVELLERRGTGAQANLIGALILVLVVVTRPLGGWIVRAHGARVRLAVGLSLVAGGLGTALLVVGNSAPAAIAGCTLLGIGSGISFSPAFTGAAALHPEAPAAAVGLVNSAGAAAVLVCTPLLGLTFSLPGDGRLGFAVATAVWFVALLVLPDRRALGGGLADPSPPAALSRDAARG